MQHLGDRALHPDAQDRVHAATHHDPIRSRRILRGWCLPTLDDRRISPYISSANPSSRRQVDWAVRGLPPRTVHLVCPSVRNRRAIRGDTLVTSCLRALIESRRRSDSGSWRCHSPSSAEVSGRGS
jgi:hypothetical protein